jgi:hypothetical protein
MTAALLPEFRPLLFPPSKPPPASELPPHNGPDQPAEGKLRTLTQDISLDSSSSFSSSMPSSSEPSTAAVGSTTFLKSQENIAGTTAAPLPEFLELLAGRGEAGKSKSKALEKLVSSPGPSLLLEHYSEAKVYGREARESMVLPDRKPLPSIIT